MTERNITRKSRPIYNFRMGTASKSERGFSLVEVIISIAALALASSIILQLFLVAADRNERGKRTDMAILYAQSALEAFKGAKKPQDAFGAFLPGLWQERQGGWHAEAMFSDDAFSNAVTDPSGAQYSVEAVVMPKRTGHETTLPLNLDGSGGNVVSEIYRMTIRIGYFRADGSELTLLTIGADNLFTFLEVAG